MVSHPAGATRLGLIGALSLVALGACSSPGGTALATSRAGAFDNGCPAARIDGVLVVDAGPGTAIVGGGGRYGLVWPYGYSARRTGDVLEVLDESGHTIARTGETVALGGGILSEGRWTTCGPPLERA